MKKIISTLCVMFLCGCAHHYPESRLGHFTAASSFNVRNLEYDTNSATRVTGEDCYAEGSQPNDSRLQRAMDNAIKNGQDKGVTGDLLVNVRIDEVVVHKPVVLFIKRPYFCIRVEGELVTLK